MDERAAELRGQLGIPPPGSPANGANASRDGWLIRQLGHARFIGLIRGTGPGSPPDLLARILRNRLREHSRLADHVHRSFATMDAAGHHVDDPAVALAIAFREGTANISLSSQYRCTYHYGGADNIWAIRRRLPIPSAVRRRMREAYDTQWRRTINGEPHPVHQTEGGHYFQPASVMGRDRLIVYSGRVLLAQRQLESQMRRVLGGGGWAVGLSDLTVPQRRAWTQLSFGRGGGGGLVRALRRALELRDMQSIFTDASMLEADSVKRARVTAGDAALIEQFVLPMTQGTGASQEAAR